MLTTRPPISPRLAARRHLRRDSLDQPHRRAHVRGPDLVGHLVAEAERAFRRQPIGRRACSTPALLTKNVYLGQSVTTPVWRKARAGQNRRVKSASRGRSAEIPIERRDAQRMAWSRVAIALPMPRAAPVTNACRMMVLRWRELARHGGEREACRRSGSTSLGGVKSVNETSVGYSYVPTTPPQYTQPSLAQPYSVRAPPQSSSLTAGCSSNSTSTENSGSNSLHLRSLCAPSTSDLT